jgi:hypothetical protein
VKGFWREVIDSIERGGDTDNLVLKINGSKHTWDITLSEVNQCVLFAVLTQGTDSAGPPAALLAKAKANVTRFLGLLRRYSSGPAKQGYYLAGLSALVARDQAWLEVLPKVGPMAIKTTVITGHFQILHLLYDKDVLEDSAILSWMDQPGPEPALKAAIRGKCQAFVAWLKQEDSDSEE